MNWFGVKKRAPSKSVIEAREALADADRRLAEATRAAEVSKAVKLSLQELRAKDHFTPIILPRRGK